MLRKLVLPLLATAVLAGCATDYRYRDGNGDYYYGSPQVESRYMGPGGYYGSVGLGYGSAGYGYGTSYYYDRFGRLVYGYPGSYGSGYYGGNGWYRPRPRQGHGGRGDDRDDRDDHDDDNGHDRGNSHDRPPPWRNIGGMLPGRVEARPGQEAEQPRMRRDPMAAPAAMPQVRQQVESPRAPEIRERSEAPARMEGFGRGAVRSQIRRGEPPSDE